MRTEVFFAYHLALVRYRILYLSLCFIKFRDVGNVCWRSMCEDS